MSLITSFVSRRWLHALALAAIGTVAAPASSQTSPPPGPVDAKAMYEQFAAQGKGFAMAATAGPRETVFVVFDPQCPYCVKAWQAARPVASQVRFVWVPVALLNSRSEPQGAAILSAGDPPAMMERHEAIFDKGGLPVEGLQIDSAAREAVWANSRIYRRANGRNVPFIVYRQRDTGEFRAAVAPTDTETLKKALGLP